MREQLIDHRRTVKEPPGTAGADLRTICRKTDFARPTGGSPHLAGGRLCAGEEVANALQGGALSSAVIRPDANVKPSSQVG